MHWCAPWLGGTGQAWNTELLRISELYFWYLYVSFGLLYILKRLKNVYNVLDCPLWQSTLGDALSSPITFWQFSMNCEEWSHSRVNPGGNSYVPVNLQHKILLWPLKILATMTSDPSQQISTILIWTFWASRFAKTLLELHGGLCASAWNHLGWWLALAKFCSVLARFSQFATLNLSVEVEPCCIGHLC